MNTGQKLKKVREAKGIAVAKVAEKLDTTETAIYLRENQRPPVKIESLRAHVKALGGKLDVVASWRSGETIKF